MHRCLLHFLLCLLMLSFSVTLAGGQINNANTLSVREAMHTAYGNVGKENRSTTEYKGKTISVEVLHFASPSRDNGNKAFLVTNETRTEDNDCHACAPLIGFFVFEKSYRGWKLSSYSKNLVHAGVWGEPPTVDLVKIGPERWALAINSGFSSLGDTEDYIALFLPDANGVHMVFSATTLEELEAMCERDENGIVIDGNADGKCFSESTEVFVLPSSGRLYDLKSVKTDRVGKKGPDGKNIMTVIEEQYFRFDAGQNKYLPIDKDQTSGPAVLLLDENSNYRKKERSFGISSGGELFDSLGRSVQSLLPDYASSGDAFLWV